MPRRPSPVRIELDVAAGRDPRRTGDIYAASTGDSKCGEEHGVTVVDDYGHHPTEIRATLAAARSCCRNRCMCCFSPIAIREPASDGRVCALFPSGRSGPGAGYLCRFRAAHRGRVIRKRWWSVCAQFGHRGAEYADSAEAGVEAVARGPEPGDLILTLGAGSVSQLGDRILEALMLKRALEALHA